MDKSNHLINEKSPYLLQHAYNPVNWFPWRAEAFKKASDENKPIFLSIGYATCHWCHVMEKESFEDDEVAQILNDHFVSIKVDREERPDVDSVYMNVAQVMTSKGGWPLTIIMTPSKKPFFAGTYIPKSGRFGMMGLIDLLHQVKDLWKEKKDEVLTKADEVTSHIRKGSSFSQTTYDAQELFIRAFNELDNSFDNEFGGFGSAPKFPTTHRLLFLLRYWKRTGDQLPLDMVEKSLRKMRLGGVYDHIGFGFHRYSTDKEWLVPHFEKMLYDQAMIAIAYIESFQATKKEEYKKTADEIFNYVLRDMTSPEGGFYSAEDADSEGVEGKFYVWSKKEIEKILEKDDAELFFDVFNLTKEGNFQDEATQKKTGENILHLKQSLMDIAVKRDIVFDDLSSKLENIRNQLFEIREKRIHPLKDDKILTDWNGLMIAALAKAARVFDKPSYLEKAENAMNFILTKMQQEDGRLLHRYRDDDTALISNLDDYAFLIWGLLELYETSFKSVYLEKAIELNKLTIKHFWDEENGAFFFTPDDGEELLIREKLIYDGAIPSGNSVSILNLLKIGRMTSNPEYEEKADIIAKTFAKQLQKIPYAYSFLLSALDFAVGPSFEVVLVGKENDQLTKEMIENLRTFYIPNKVLIFKDLSDFKDIETLIPSLKDYKEQNEKSTAYVCQNFICNRPTNDIQIMLNQLKEVENKS